MSVGREILGYENREKIIHVRITGGGAAPACVSKGVAAVAKLGAGNIKVTLDRPYKRLLKATAEVQINGAVVATITDAVNVDPRNVTVDGTLLLWTAATAGGAAADIAATRDIYLDIIVSDSDV